MELSTEKTLGSLAPVSEDVVNGILKVNVLCKIRSTVAKVG